MMSKRPYSEGAWMDKHEGKYYLQYAAPGTQYNTYSDGVYVGDSPMDRLNWRKTIRIPINRADSCRAELMEGLRARFGA
jgi:hypothetical protein